MKKLLALVLVAMMALSLVSGAFAEEKQVLTVVTWDANTTPYLVAQEAAFEAAYPNVDLQYIDVASQDYGIKAMSMLSGNDTSDVFMVKEVSDIVNWSAQGFAEPLTPYIEKDAYDVSGFVGMEANYAFDGVQYALPFRSDFWVLFYNKDLFDAAGVAYPTNDMTWDAYAQLAKDMTKE
ncbi:MAG: extracellular solute-binding protein, partial [Clostridia bacterium]|nr:extracellular solute-binding protein [Clostridia bacterium]